MLLFPLFLVAIQSMISAHAHAHHDVSPEQLNEPIDAILYLHMGFQALVWGVLFPIGMVFGLTRSRWHVPLQSLAFVLAFSGIIFGHVHRGRQFPHSFHGSLGSWLLLPILSQLFLGIYLKLHIHEKTIRPYAIYAHGILGRIWPILGWVQCLFGVIVLHGFCGETGVRQCSAHYIMGSSFIAWGVIMALLLVLGENWVRQSARSPEWWDSWFIVFWGIVNTFTEHNAGDEWTVKDMQHTACGVFWWAGGALGVYLARNNQRNVVPGLVFILTGWAISEHTQVFTLSTKVHMMFGCTIMLAGCAWIIEVCFITASTLPGPLQDDNEREHPLMPKINMHGDSKAEAARAFRYMRPFLVVASGLLFMSATNEELTAVNDMGMDHVTYILGMYSLAFLLYLFTLYLFNLYATSGRNAETSMVCTDDAVFAAPPPNGEVELTSPKDAFKWYTPVPREAVQIMREDGD